MSLPFPRSTRMIAGCALLMLCSKQFVAAAAWQRHVIDDSSVGSDGVRLMDLNGDGREDIVTGWEEAGIVRVYLHPAGRAVRQAWPQVTVGRVPAPEDAVFVDVDRDGKADVVSCCEGSERSVFVHWSPREPKRLLDEKAWRTESFPQLAQQQLWMYCLPAQLDQRWGHDLVIGSKGANASVSLVLSPENPSQLADWVVVRLRPAGWIMSLEIHDMNADGLRDIVLSDRRGRTRGVYWLEHPGVDAVMRPSAWTVHVIGGTDQETMFLTIADLDADDKPEIIATTQQGTLLIFRDQQGSWRQEAVPLPNGHRRGKGIAAGDIDRDGRMDLVVSTEDGCVAWLRHVGIRWQHSDIGGNAGRKFDRIELLDIDQDGDLDVLTCEERARLGVVWYENPLGN